MSFTTSLKSEILKSNFESECCKYAFFAGLMSFSGNIKISGKKTQYTYTTENFEVAKRFSDYADKLLLWTLKPEKHGGSYVFSIPDASIILQELDILKLGEINLSLPNDLTSDCCASAFIKGAFLSGGSMAAPEKQYHLEFVTPHYKLNLMFQELFLRFDIQPKWIVRKSKYVTYFKDSELINDVLVVLNAPEAIWALNNASIYKSYINNTNRVVNCESANLDKIVEAAIRQTEAIKFIDEKIGIENLPKNLIQLAKLRLEYGELSLLELGELLETPISKSGVNHRMRKIMEISNRLKEN